jgi:hypothetical protein
VRCINDRRCDAALQNPLSGKRLFTSTPVAQNLSPTTEPQEARFFKHRRPTQPSGQTDGCFALACQGGRPR